MQAYQASGRFKVVGDAWRFGYRADGLRVVKEKVPQAVASVEGEAGGSSRTEYLYDGQMPVCEQEFVGSTLRTTRVNFLGARGIEAVVAVDHTRGNAVALRWLLYDGHGNLVRTMAPDYTLSAFQWRGVWGEGQGSLGTWRGYCANLGHPEDETSLVYMRTRYYEPATGRFISEDPARDGVNWYLYADGNPIKYADLRGTDFDLPDVLTAIAEELTLCMMHVRNAALGVYVRLYQAIAAGEDAYKVGEAVFKTKQFLEEAVVMYEQQGLRYMITEAFGRSSALDVYLARQVILVLYTLIVEGI
jgi:RHS repeat-associated protein